MSNEIDNSTLQFNYNDATKTLSSVASSAGVDITIEYNQALLADIITLVKEDGETKISRYTYS